MENCDGRTGKRDCRDCDNWCHAVDPYTGCDVGDCWVHDMSEEDLELALRGACPHWTPKAPEGACIKAVPSVRIERKWAMPNSRTFTIGPIKELIERHIKGREVILDPFACDSGYGTITNDLNPEYDTMYHMDALTFMDTVPSESVDCVLYDPPYSITQAAQCYKSYGKDRLAINVANMKYWSSMKDECARVLKRGGICLCFGWTSMGLGKNRGFDMTEILLVPHGGSKNDTICTVEVKL